jgi:hypothetical protein
MGSVTASTCDKLFHLLKFHVLASCSAYVQYNISCTSYTTSADWQEATAVLSQIIKADTVETTVEEAYTAHYSSLCSLWTVAVLTYLQPA